MVKPLIRMTLLGALAVALMAPPALAAPDKIRTPGKFGIGLGAGTLANGLSAKYWVATDHALQFNLGIYGGGGFSDRFKRFRGFAVSADYLFEMPDIVTAGEAFVLGWNLGAGVGVGVRGYDNDDRAYVAGAFIAGLEFRFIPIPLDIVIEYRPALLIVPDVALKAVDFTAHIRVYF